MEFYYKYYNYYRGTHERLAALSIYFLCGRVCVKDLVERKLMTLHIPECNEEQEEWKVGMKGGMEGGIRERGE